MSNILFTKYGNGICFAIGCAAMTLLSISLANSQESSSKVPTPKLSMNLKHCQFVKRYDAIKNDIYKCIGRDGEQLSLACFSQYMSQTGRREYYCQGHHL